jgi:hypothetical protein
MSNATKKDAHSVSVAAKSADAFFREVAEHQCVWAIRDAGGFPTATSSGKTAMPFWSSRTRAESVIASVPDYAKFEPVELPWDGFRDRWLPGLERDGLRVGLNWSGERALGYDYSPADVLERIQDELSKHNPSA